MIFPIVIACVMAVIYIVINLYLSASLQASVHTALRKESGRISETVDPLATTKAYPYEEEMIGLRPSISMEQEKEYRINTIFRDRLIRIETGRTYVIDEAELVRILTFHEE